MYATHRTKMENAVKSDALPFFVHPVASKCAINRRILLLLTNWNESLFLLPLGTFFFLLLQKRIDRVFLLAKTNRFGGRSKTARATVQQIHRRHDFCFNRTTVQTASETVIDYNVLTSHENRFQTSNAGQEEEEETVGKPEGKTSDDSLFRFFVWFTSRR